MQQKNESVERPGFRLRALHRPIHPRVLQEIGKAALDWRPWAALVAVVLALPIAIVDQALLRDVRIPSYEVAGSARVLFVSAIWLLPISVLLVNGIVIPFAEEWLWRGAIQPRAVAAFGKVAGIAATAVLFSLKHAIVDASLGRLLTVLAISAIVS